MSLFNRRTLLLSLTTLPLAACGFSPVYRKGGAASSLYGTLRFNLIESREGFLLLEHVTARLGPSNPAARFDVSLTMEITEDELVLTSTTSIIRHTLNGLIKLTVTDVESGEAVFTDKFRETSGYSTNAQTAVSASAKRDATDRLVQALADMVVLRLSSTSESWAA